LPFEDPREYPYGDYSLKPKDFATSRAELWYNKRMTEDLVFLKLGGSLITDKTRPYTPLKGRLKRIAAEIAEVLRAPDAPRLLLGHGSGSFGHTAGKRYHTREGISAKEDAASYWRGFAEVRYQAAALNALVMEALRDAGLAAIAFPPSAGMRARDGRAISWDIESLRDALRAGLLPVVYGDVVFDEIRGGTILSTEEIFAFLAAKLPPVRILLAGLEAGVYADFPARTRILRVLLPESIEKENAALGESHGTDVTGGMSAKVRQMLALAEAHPGMDIYIFSGVEAGNIARALRGEAVGTVLRSSR
jgi:isopentenyl phosphate kinase